MDEFGLALVDNLDSDVVTELCTGRLFAEQQALRRQRIARARQGTRTFLKDGEVSFQIDPYFYHKWGQRLGYECWDNEDFVRGMLRDNPEMRIDGRSRKIMTGYRGPEMGAEFLQKETKGTKGERRGADSRCSGKELGLPL